MTTDTALHRTDSGVAALRPAAASGIATLWRGSVEDPAWARPALIGLLMVTAGLYLWGLSASGYANSFYSAAAQAGSASWKAFFFGASDSVSSITVDKPPLALWPMALSVRVFGLSSWTILFPQAVEGVVTVALLHATVRRTTGSAFAGLLSAAVLALTPVAVLLFKFNNRDAMLVLLLVGAAYATLRGVESTRVSIGAPSHPVCWLALGGTLVGLAFLTKMMQAFLVLPALALVYLVAANASIPRRIGHLVVAAGAMIASAGWWIAIVSLWPASSRPYIGGSQGNSILELTLGYNGFGRLTGNETGSVGGGNGSTGQWGSTGILRMFTSEIGGQVAWMLPADLVLLVAGLWFTRQHPRADGVRASLLLWGTWLLVTALTFSFMAGIFHAYYTVALAPAIAALVGTGAWLLWERRGSLAAMGVASFSISMTSVLAFHLLGRSPDFLPWLRWVVLAVGLVSALLVVALGRFPRRIAVAVGAVALTASLAGPAAYAVQTAGTGHEGAIVAAGPTSATGPGGPGGGVFPGGPPGLPGGVTPGGTTTRGGASTGGLLNGSESSPTITALLQKDAASYTWVASAVGSNSAAGYQLASQEPVMAIGGFNGSDPSPTLAQFQKYVSDGRIHYFIAGGGAGRGPSAGSSGSTSKIAGWVGDNFTATTVDGVNLYDLTGSPTTASGSLA